MTTRLKSPKFSFTVGDETDFKISVVLPAVESTTGWPVNSANSILYLTEGYITFFVNNINVLEINSEEQQDVLSASHSRLSLSMFLEWILFDKCYLPAGGNISFSDLVAGESSPNISFTLRDGIVDVQWNLVDWQRSKANYLTPIGNGDFGYVEYLTILLTGLEILVAGIETRAKNLSLVSQWHKWWSGYDAELTNFTSFVEKSNA